MKKNSVIFFVFLVSFTSILGQKSDTAKIAQFRKQSIDAKTDAEKIVFNDSLIEYVTLFLDQSKSYNTPLSNIHYLGDLYSPDNAFRMVTWNLSRTDGTHTYYCYIQKKPDDTGKSSWYELEDNHQNIDRPNYKTLKSDNWYGCLYYSIIPFKSNKTMMYVLLGWEGHNNYSNKKLIECLSFDSKDEPVFGKSVFVGEKNTSRRVVFEYSKEAYLLLRYNEDSKQIIFNRLEPMKPELEGVYSFYAPSLTYDAFQLKKGKWEKVLDINPKNGKTNDVFHNPKSAPKPPQ